MFCSRCGKPLFPSAAFCSDCGSRIDMMAAQACVQSLPAAPRPPQTATRPLQQPAGVDTVPGAEDVLLVIRTTRRLTMTSAAVCHVVFKRNLLLLAYLTERLQLSESARFARELNAQTLSATKRTVAQTRFWDNFHKRYYSMTTEDILAEEPFNGAIKYTAVALIDYASTYSVFDENSSYDYDGILHLTLTNGEVLRFKHKERQNDAVKELLTALFGPRLRYKK